MALELASTVLHAAAAAAISWSARLPRLPRQCRPCACCLENAPPYSLPSRCRQVLMYPMLAILLAVPLAVITGLNPTQLVLRIYFGWHAH